MCFNNLLKVVSYSDCSSILFSRTNSSSLHSSYPFLSDYGSSCVEFSSYCLIPESSSLKSAFAIHQRFFNKAGEGAMLRSGEVVYRCPFPTHKGESFVKLVVPEYQYPRASKNGESCYTQLEISDRERSLKEHLDCFVKQYLSDFDINYMRSGFDKLCGYAYYGVKNPVLSIEAITALFACDDLIDNVKMTSGFMHLISGRIVQSLQTGILDRLPRSEQLPFIIDTLALVVDPKFLKDCAASFLSTEEQERLQTQEGYNLFPFTHIAKIYCRSGGVCPDAAPTYESKLESNDGLFYTKSDILPEKSFTLLQLVSAEDKVAFGDTQDIRQKEALETVMRKIGNDLCDQVVSNYSSDRWKPVLVDYLNTYREYVLGTKLEVSAREKNHTFSENEYKLLRRKTGGVEVAFSIGCIMLGIDWPSISGIKEINNLRDVANDHIVWFNDLTSVLKDLIEGFDENLVINKVHNKGMMFDEAFDDVLSEVSNCMHDIGALIGEIKDKYPDNADVQAYCIFVKNWIRANVDWSKATKRYGYEVLCKKFCV